MYSFRFLCSAAHKEPKLSRIDTQLGQEEGHRMSHSADSFWKFVKKEGREITMKEIWRGMNEIDPRTCPDDLMYSVVNGRRWCALLFGKVGDERDMRILEFAEFAGQGVWGTVENRVVILDEEIVEGEVDPEDSLDVTISHLVARSNGDKAEFRVMREIIKEKGLSTEIAQFKLWSLLHKKADPEEGSLIGCRAEYPYDNSVEGKFGRCIHRLGCAAPVARIVWRSQTPLQKSFALSILKEAGFKVGNEQAVIVGQHDPMVTALYSHDGSWYILAGVIDDISADEFIPTPFDGPPTGPSNPSRSAPEPA